MGSLAKGLFASGLGLVALTWGCAVVGHRVALDEAMAGLDETWWTDDEVDRFLADQARIVELGVLAPRPATRDAGEILNPHVGLDDGTPADAPIWWSAPEVKQTLKDIEGGWLAAPEQAPEGDLSLLTALLDYDHLESSSGGAFARYREQLGPMHLTLDALPDHAPLITLSKLRLARGLVEADMEPALREVRHLAELLHTDETLITSMLAVAILSVERRAYEAAVERELLAPEAWTPVSEDDTLAMRRAGMGVVSFATGFAGDAAWERVQGELDLFGLCGGLHEATGTSLLLWPYTGGAWPMEADASWLHEPTRRWMEGSSCRLPLARQTVADPSQIDEERLIAAMGAGGSGAGTLGFHASRAPYVRRVVGAVLFGVAAPSFNQYR